MDYAHQLLQSRDGNVTKRQNG